MKTMRASNAALDALARACTQILSERKRELFFSALTDRSFEEGVRARDFGESMATLRRAGLPSDLASAMDGGVNGMLAHAFRADRFVEYLGQSPSRGADHRLVVAGCRMSIETKIIYDLTMPKYYAQVAADRSKCQSERVSGAADHAFQVVFFFELPAFDYPAGSWYAGKVCSARSGYPGVRGISSQYSKVMSSLGPAHWPDAAPLTADICPAPGSCEDSLAANWMQSIFRPGTPWTFETARHAAGARVGAAVWAW